MDESRKSTAALANAKSSSLDEDFGNDFLSTWKLPKSGKDTIDFDVESVPKSSKKFSFDNLDDFGLDGAFDKLSSFKMGISELDFSSPPKKKVKLNSSDGDNLAEGRKETEKDNFSFSFDFNELGKFNLDTKLGIEEKGKSKFREKVDTVSSEGNKDPQRGLSGKCSDTLGDNIGTEQTQTQDTCTLRPTHLTSFNSARLDQNKVDMMLTDTHEESSKETCPSKAAINMPSRDFPCGSTPGEDPTHVTATEVPEICKEVISVGPSKDHITRENNDSEQSVSSQSRNTSTMCPSISRRLMGQPDSRNDHNEVMEKSACLNEESHGNQSSRGISMKLLKKTSYETKKTEEGTSGPKNLSSSMQRDNRNVQPALVNKNGESSLLSKSAIMKASRPAQLTSETTFNQLSGANNMVKNIHVHSTELKREHKQSNKGKPKIAPPKPFCKPALQGLLSTSMNAMDHRKSKLGLESPGSGNVSALNATGSTLSNEHNTIVSRSLLRSTNVSDVVKSTPKDDDRPISELKRARPTKVDTVSPKHDFLLAKELMEVSGRKGSPVTTSRISNSYVEEKTALPGPSMMQNIPKESVSDRKAPTVLKCIMGSSAVRKSPRTVSELGNQTIPGSGTPKARMDNAIASAIPCEMGDISELESPALLENDGNVEKAEACRKELEDLCISLKRKHAEAKELAVRAVVNNNVLLMLNHPMFEEKICALQKFANSLRSKTFLFEDISATDSH